MREVAIRTTDGKTLIVPAEVTGLYLIDLLGEPRLTLGIASLLNNGDVLRGFMPVGPDERRFDLGTFDDIFLCGRRWFASILPVERSWGGSILPWGGGMEKGELRNGIRLPKFGG